MSRPLLKPREDSEDEDSDSNVNTIHISVSSDESADEEDSSFRKEYDMN